MIAKGSEASYKTTSFRAEESLLEEARAVFDAHGLSLNAAISLYLQECVRQRRIPESILNPGKDAFDHASSDLILRNVGVFLQLSDYGDPRVPAKDFARDVVLEFSRGIFEDCHGPWIDLVKKVARIAFMDSEGLGSDEFYFDDVFYLVEDLLPEKLPYDYAEEIVRETVKDWVKADLNASLDMEAPFDVVMGRILKRSHLTLEDLMGELVKEGAVEERDGVTFNRSCGMLVEGMVSRLKEKGLWGNPAPRCGIAFVEADESSVELAVNDCVSFRLGVNPDAYLSCDHPISLMFEDLDCSVSSIVEDRYFALFDECTHQVEDALFDVFGNCEFKYPPKAVYDECARRYGEALDAAEPGSIAARSRELCKSPIDAEDSFLYLAAIDMEPSLWPELYSREAFLAVCDAIESGVLPEPTGENPDL